MERTLQLKRTERNIIDAFIRLLECKSFEKIIISDILNEAMISRYTFYAHFKDKYDVAERIQDNFFVELQKILDEMPFNIFEMTSINKVFQKYYQANQKLLKAFAALVDIKDESWDATKGMENFAKKNLLINANSATIDQEAFIYASIMICFMKYSIKNSLNPCILGDDSFHIFSDIILNTFLPFFHVVPNEANKKALLLELSKYNN